MKKGILCLDCGHYFWINKKKRKRRSKTQFHIPTHSPACRDIRWIEERTQGRQIKKYERNTEHERF